MIDKEQRKRKYFKLATDAYRKSDDSLWPAIFACGNVVGNYDRGATMGLASDMGVSTDTVEDMAHAYWIYSEMCEFEDGKFRQFVRQARRAPFIYYSHFRALYDAKSQYKLSTQQVLDLLMDIVQAEGTISSNGVDGHTRSRYGDTRGWEFYGARAEKELGQTLMQPDMPNIPEMIGNAYRVTFSTNDNKLKILSVVAANPERAENIARKTLALEIDPKVVKKMTCSIKPMGEVVTDSKHLLNTTYGWLGEKA